MKNLLIISGHPSKQSFCAALAKSYLDGALEGGADVKYLELGELKFDPILHLGYKGEQELEPDLAEAQRLIKWADHIVFVYPTWWGSIPALLKGFLDRVFLPGFAFKYKENSQFWDKYLKGKTARLIVTMDAPIWYDRLFYGAASRRAVKRATLEFCGIKPVKITAFGSVKFADETKRRNWLEKVRILGTELR